MIIPFEFVFLGAGAYVLTRLSISLIEATTRKQELKHNFDLAALDLAKMDRFLEILREQSRNRRDDDDGDDYEEEPEPDPEPVFGDQLDLTKLPRPQGIMS